MNKPAIPKASAQPVLRQDFGSIAHLTLNRPNQRNCLSLDMLASLQSALDALAGDEAVRVIMLSASGPVFCAGHDLKELTAHRADADAGAAFFQSTIAACSRLMLSIIALPQPVIAVVEGMATAAGCQLVATCDLAVCGSSAQFCTPGVDIGLFCSTPMVALSRTIPRKAAMGMLLTGEPIGAADALRHGLVNQVVVPGSAMAAATALARTIAAKPRAVVAQGKRTFYAQADMQLGDAYRYTSEIMARCLLSHEAREGIGAFLEKREPVWPHQTSGENA